MKPNSYQLNAYIVLRHILVSNIWCQEPLAILVGGKTTGDDVVERVQPKLVESRSTHSTGVVNELVLRAFLVSRSINRGFEYCLRGVEWNGYREGGRRGAGVSYVIQGGLEIELTDAMSL